MIKAQSLVKQNTNRKSNIKYNTYKCTQTTKIVIETGKIDLLGLVREGMIYRKQESRAAARKPRDAASVLFR